MDKLKEQAVLTIVELLKKEQAAERAKEYENQLLEMLEEQDRKEIAEVLGKTEDNVRHLAKRAREKLSDRDFGNFGKI